MNNVGNVLFLINILLLDVSILFLCVLRGGGGSRPSGLILGNVTDVVGVSVVILEY